MKIGADHRHKITKGHFDKFSKYVSEWRVKLGLTEWDIVTRVPSDRDSGEIENNKAIVYMNRTGMVATIVLNTVWDDVPPTNIDLERCAIHELLEIMLNPLRILGESRYNVDEVDMEYESHRVIRKLVEVLSK